MFLFLLLKVSDKLWGVNFIKFCKVVLIVLVVFILLFVGLFIKSGLYYGVDFIGGIMVEFIVFLLFIDNLREFICI